MEASKIPKRIPKYLSLEEARNAGKLEQFAKEHLSEANKLRRD